MSEKSLFLHICILGFKCLEYWLNFPFHLPLEVKLGQFQKGQKESTKHPRQQWSLNQSRGHLHESRVTAFSFQKSELQQKGLCTLRILTSDY